MEPGGRTASCPGARAGIKQQEPQRVPAVQSLSHTQLPAAAAHLCTVEPRKMAADTCLRSCPPGAGSQCTGTVQHGQGYREKQECLKKGLGLAGVWRGRLNLEGGKGETGKGREKALPAANITCAKAPGLRLGFCELWGRPKEKPHSRDSCGGLFSLTCSWAACLAASCGQALQALPCGRPIEGLAD